MTHENDSKYNKEYQLAKWCYVLFRVGLRSIMSKKRRDEYLNKKRIRIGSFFIHGDRVLEKYGIKAFVRKNSDDYFHLFMPRELELTPHFELFENETFLDVGANVGLYTLKLLSKKPNASVIAIEADPENFLALKKNVYDVNNYSHVILVNKAAYHSNGKIKLYVRGGFSGLPSIHKKRKLPGKPNYADEYVTVNCDLVDNILKYNGFEKADLIKIDVEGAEVEVLKGATKTLKFCRKVIVEVHHENLEKVKSILLENNIKVDVLKIKNGTYVVGTKKK